MALARVLCVATLVSAASAANYTYTWVQTTVDAMATSPPARHSAAMAAFNGQFIVFGGKGNKANGSSVLGDLWGMTISGGSATWMLISEAVQRSNAGPSGRYSTVYGVMDSYLLISHGQGESEVYDETWALDMSTWEWKQVNTSFSLEVPEARFDAAGGVYGNRLWLCMGRSKDERTLSDTWILTINSSINNDSQVELIGEWIKVHSGGGLNQYDPFLPHARYMHSGTLISMTKFVMFGGCASGGFVGGPCPLGDSWILDSEEREWTKLSDCPSPRTDAVMIRVFLDLAILVMGDEEGGLGPYPQRLSDPGYNTSDVTELEAGNETTWVQYRGSGVAQPLGRTDPAITHDGMQVVLFGGRSIRGEKLVMVDVWQLQISEGEGEEMECPGIPFSFLHLHGVIMYLAWGLLLPLGALLGRYYRHYWPTWFILHILLQSLGVLLTVAGFVLVFLVSSYSEPNFPHAYIGIILTAMLIQQFLNGIFHPCVDRENGKTPKEEKSGYRRCWELYHATSGFLIVALGLGQVVLGVFLIVPPFPVWIACCVLIGLWVPTFLIHEVIYITLKICHWIRDQEY